MKRKILIIFISVCIITSTFFILQRLLIPKYISDIPEGSLIEEYYNEKEYDHDVIFIGDCEVYENFSPITLWTNYGMKSYIRGSAQQLIWQSYYLMKETITYEKPDVIVFNVLSMKYDKPQSEAYNRLTLDGMKWSINKWESIKASMMENESMIDYYFPLLRYHQRWNELTSEDFHYIWNDKPQISHNGFLMRVDELAVDKIPDAKPLLNYQFSDICYEYLDKMVRLCKENDIELILIKAPSLYPAWYDEWDEQMVEYSKKNNVEYINFLNCINDIGLDYQHDTYDGGLHLNLSGAEKLSDYFGKYLSEKYHIKDSRNDKNSNLIWSEKMNYYKSMEKDQYRELKEYGYLKSYGGKAPDEKKEEK